MNNEQPTMSEALSPVQKLRLAGTSFTEAWRRVNDATYEIGTAAGFYGPGVQFNDGEKLALMHSEISEALEGLRGGPFPGKPDDKLTHRPMVEAELADLVIRVMNYGRHRGLDVAGAVIEKAIFNASRPRLHGKKF